MHKSAPSDVSRNLRSSGSNATSDNDIGPLNLMFSNLPQSRVPGQKTYLPTERETSSIPRGDSGLWEYPSPQQMYNAMLRKGHTDTPAEDVESMVAVHNFLNEGAWAEIEEWESLFSQGLVKGWEVCRRGEEGIRHERARREHIAALRGAPAWIGDERQRQPAGVL